MGDSASGCRAITIDTADPRFSFRIAAPADWVRMTPPGEQSDDMDNESFRPVAILAAPYGAVVLTLSVRPAPTAGTVAEWLGRLAAGDGVEFTEIGPAMAGGVPAVGAEGEQPGDMGPMHLRLLMFEQGGWAHSLLGMAPAAIWGSLGPVFDEMFGSFAMVEELPTSVATWPEDDDASDLSPAGLAVARETAERFLAAIQRGDETAARALLVEADTDSVSFPFQSGDDSSFTLGEAGADDGCAVVAATLRSRPAERSEPEVQELPLVLRQEYGEWRIDMSASIERMLGFDLEAGLGDLAEGFGAAVEDMMGGLTEDQTTPGTGEAGEADRD